MEILDAYCGEATHAPFTRQLRLAADARDIVESVQQTFRKAHGGYGLGDFAVLYEESTVPGQPRHLQITRVHEVCIVELIDKNSAWGACD